MQEKECEVCKEKFEPKSWNAKVCSKKCRRTIENRRNKRYKEKKHGYKIGFLNCEKCGIEVKRMSSGQKYCKECRNIIRKQQKIGYAITYNRKRGHLEIKSRNCEWCGKNFLPKAYNAKVCSPECFKLKRLEYHKKRMFEMDPEKIREQKRRSYQNNKEAALKRTYRWRKENPEKHRAEARRHHYKRMKKNPDNIRAIGRRSKQKTRSTPEGKIIHRMRERIRKMIKGGNGSPRTNELLGCDAKFLRKYIELQFIGDMSWEELFKGSIHLDHIRPCASFDLSKPEEQRQCFNYSNLQPLWAKDNMRKSSKYQGKTHGNHKKSKFSK